MFLDNDDEYVEDFCKKMYDTIENHQCDIVTCRNYDVVKGETRNIIPFWINDPIL